MKLFTKADNTKLFANYSKGSNMANQNVVVKIFNPYGKGRWYIMNSDPNDPDYLWGIVDLGYGPEVGSISRSDLENYRNRFGWGFERDLSFRPKNANVVLDGLKEGNFFDGGGEVEFIEYGDSEIMYEPNDKKYYANDMEFDTLKEAKKFIDSGEVPYFIKDAYSKGLFAGGGKIEDEDIKKLNAYWESYYKGIKAGEKDKGYTSIKNTGDLNNYIISILGNVVKKIELIEKGKNYPDNFSNPYYEDIYSVELKNGTTFIIVRSYGRPRWEGNVDYKEQIIVKNIKQYAGGGFMDGVYAGGGATKKSKLFTKEDDKILFKQHQFGKDLKKQDAIVEIYQNYGNIHYYIVNADPKDPDTLLAIIKDDINDEVEVDFISRKLLENKAEHGIGGTTERIFDTTPYNADRLYWYLATGKFYAKGGSFMDGVYAGGGSVSNFIKKTYGNLVEKQGILTTKTNWFNKDGVKVLEYGFDPYRNEESNTLFYYSWDYRDSGMDYEDFENQLVDFFKKTYKKDVIELRTYYVGWKRKEKDTYVKGGAFMDGVYAGGGSISNFDPMSLIGKTFYSLQSHGKIINVRILSNDNIKIKYEVSNTFSVEKSFTKKELFDMAKGKEVDGNSILKSTMAYGGKTTFAEKSSAIAKNFVGKAVEPKYQSEYGKRYDAKEAKEVGNKIAGKQKATYDQKNMKVGGTTKRGDKFRLITQKAKEIRKEGEKWTDAVKRASAMLK
jgi:hypothetical protein